MEEKKIRSFELFETVQIHNNGMEVQNKHKFSLYFRYSKKKIPQTKIY
jgi:hypothetical protein